MVCVDWASAYAERHHDATIKRIMRRIGSRPDRPVCAATMAEVDALTARLSGTLSVQYISVGH
jgi:hypothetical protein